MMIDLNTIDNLSDDYKAGMAAGLVEAACVGRWDKAFIAGIDNGISAVDEGCHEEMIAELDGKPSYADGFRLGVWARLNQRPANAQALNDKYDEDEQYVINWFFSVAVGDVAESIPEELWTDEMDDNDPLTILTPEQQEWLIDAALAFWGNCDSKIGSDRFEYSIDSDWYGGYLSEFKAEFGL